MLGDVITEDGCTVEVYAALPAAGEADVVHAALRPGASVLDLGCGTGRIAHPLVELGHEVLGVDSSAEMLAHCRVPTVQSRIADLDLGRTFDCVLLASHLLNGDDRASLLSASVRHLAADGVLVAQWFPPEWFDGVGDSTGSLGDVGMALRVVAWEPPELRAVSSYTVAGVTYDHPWTSWRLTEDELDSELAAAGLVRTGWLTPDRHWVSISRRP